MTDRVISVRLRIAVAEARRDARAAADAIRGIADAAEKAGRSTAGLTRLGVAAGAAAKATAAVGAVAVGGLATMTAAVVKGGIAYNTLEQTSRAALTTLTGSAAAANAQMSELKEFGKTSPFARQIWIQAQQQLLAFGMSAEKIIPTFEAIQDAVAAAGGSGQTISEITTIIAKIQSSGKVTAEELNELGARGIDAASLIGEAMGKTAGEVRADITAQAISGVQFIDMLTGAMSERFEGAAAGVKQTWAGATDRIKGAVRDIGGLLATPLVDPHGGGAAVDWANSIADALRALESRLEPAMQALRDRAEPALDAFNDQLQELAEWIRTADFGQIAAQLKPMLPAITGVTAGLVTMGARSLPVIGGMVSGLRPLPIALATAAASSPELRQALVDLLVAAQPLLAALGQVTQVLATALGPALSLVATLLQPVIVVAEVLGNILGSLPAPIQMVIAGLIAWKALGVGSWMMQNVVALQRFSQEMKVQQSLAAMSGQQIGGMGAAYSVAATRVSGAANSIKGAFASTAGFLAGPWGLAIGLGITALIGLSTASEAVATDHAGLKDALEAGTGAVTENTRAWVLNKLETDGLANAYRHMGGNVRDLVDAYLGVPEAGRRVAAVLGENANDTDILSAEYQGLLRILGTAPQAMKDAAAAARDKGSADRDAASAADAASGAYAGLTGSLYGVGDAADSVATRTQQLNAALSGIFDAQFAGQKAADDFQSGLHRLRDAFASNDTAATKSESTGKRYSESLRRQQKIIEDTREQLEDLAEAQRKAEEEAAEAAKAARQRQLDEMFGKTFDVQSTVDAFQSALAQAGKDIKESKGIAGVRDLLGFTEGAISNRERLRGIVQAAQAAIQAERDSGASGERIGQVSAGLADQLAQQAATWGLNANEVQQYADAIRSFGNLAGQAVTVDLSAVTQDFAEQRAEIHKNSAEQLENARASGESAAASRSAAVAKERHTAALKGNSKSAIENREMMQDLVKKAQDELTQLHLSGAGRDELIAKGEALASQIEEEGIALGFAREDLKLYTDTVHLSALEVARYPVLVIRADTLAAFTTITNFVNGVNNQLANIQRKIEIKALTGMEYINSRGGGHAFLADGGFVSGPGGPREDKIPAMLSDGEFVINARDTRRNRTLLEVINQGGEVSRRGFARGGYVDPVLLHVQGAPSTGFQETFDAMMQAFMPVAALGQGPLAWAASQVGKPYLWGGVGPRGYDCSGFQSAILNMIQGRPLHARRFATGSFPTGDFARGPGNYMIGSRRGNPGHMAGTLQGVNVESRGGEGVVVGPRARGAGDRLFGGNIWHLKGYADGGLVGGDPPFDLISPLGKHFDEVLGSYAKGTNHVPMDGLYELHKGEAVVPASQNVGGSFALEGRLESDGTKFGDLVTESLNKGMDTGQIRLVRK